MTHPCHPCFPRYQRALSLPSRFAGFLSSLTHLPRCHTPDLPQISPDHPRSHWHVLSPPPPPHPHPTLSDGSCVSFGDDRNLQLGLRTTRNMKAMRDAKQDIQVFVPLPHPFFPICHTPILPICHRHVCALARRRPHSSNSRPKSLSTACARSPPAVAASRVATPPLCSSTRAGARSSGCAATAGGGSWALRPSHMYQSPNGTRRSRGFACGMKRRRWTQSPVEIHPRTHPLYLFNPPLG